MTVCKRKKQRRYIALKNPNVHNTYTVYWNISSWLKHNWAGLREQHGLEWNWMVWNGLIEMALDLSGVEWNQMKHYRLNWMKRTRIEWKVTEHNTIEYNWKVWTQREPDWKWISALHCCIMLRLTLWAVYILYTFFGAPMKNAL